MDATTITVTLTPAERTLIKSALEHLIRQAQDVTGVAKLALPVIDKLGIESAPLGGQP